MENAIFDKQILVATCLAGGKEVKFMVPIILLGCYS